MQEVAAADLPGTLAALQHAAPQLQSLADALTLHSSSTASAAELSAASAAELSARLASAVDHLLMLADAAVAAAPAAGGDAAAAAADAGKQDAGFLAPLVNTLETVLSYLQVRLLLWIALWHGAILCCSVSCRGSAMVQSLLVWSGLGWDYAIGIITQHPMPLLPL